MTLKRLRLQSLVYHWRGNAAVCLGVAIGAAVLTGALLVGSSLRASLRDLALRRLGWVDQALMAPRFFRQAVAGELERARAADRVAPAIVLRASAKTEGAQARGVILYGVESRFWGAREGVATAAPSQGVWLNSTLAEALGAKAGSKVALTLQRPSEVPRESLLGRKGGDAVVDTWELTVERVLAGDEPGNHFSLRPDLEAPRAAFVALPLLQDRLGQPGRCNALLVGGGKPELAERLHAALRLEDWGLVLQGPDKRLDELFRKLDRKPWDDKLEPREWRGRLPEALVRAIDPKATDLTSGPTLTREQVETFYRTHRNYLSLESPQLLLERPVGDAALAAAREAGLRAAPTLVYLANTIAVGDKQLPYSVVAALDPAQGPPLGPFLPSGVGQLADDQVVLADWKESPLRGSKPGERVTLTYFPPEHQGDRSERTAAFRLAGFVPLEGPAADAELTPEFPGITDKLSLDQWDPPYPFDKARIKQRVTKRDEDYWRQYRTTPKAYVTLAAGQRLWASRFGNLTSVRLAAPAGTSLTDSARAFEKSLLAHLDPVKGGFVFDPVKQDALAASGGGTDFAQLFLGFSFFLIAAALLLVGLLFRLNLDRRASEVGLLFAEGYRRRTVRWLLLSEGGALAAVGSVLGACLALGYAALLLRLLAALWPGGALRSFLRPHFQDPSTALGLVFGAAGALLVSVLTVAWVVRALGKVPPRALLAGQTTAEGESGLARRSRWGWWVAGLSAVGAAALLASARYVADHEMQALTFFGSGTLLLVAFLAALWVWMRGSRHGTVEGHGLGSVARLGVRNAARHPARSLLTAGLLASAAFVVVAVDAFRRQADAAGDAPNSPGGGFAFVAESDLPLYRNPAGPEGRQDLIESLLPRWRDELGGDNAKAEQRGRETAELLAQTKVVMFRLRAGDDASCLNLYQPRRPRVLGVPAALIERGGFVFASTLKPQDDAEKPDPWRLLQREGGPTPAFGEKNTVEWILKSGQGKEYAVPDADGRERPLLIAGLLQDSVFQSSLLVSEENFLRLYPGHEGYNFFLIAPPPGREEEVRRLLERGLADRGFEATPTATRLESYLAVENTYLSTFQALGGLGLVLGSLGLAVVLLRGVWERRGELALLRALGYRRATLGWLVLAENGFLLVLGLLMGTAAALVAVAPHLAGAGGVPWAHLLALLGVVLVVGLAAGGLATASTLRAPLVPALRKE
jgi:ABC-type antimicrobial peptide transport system permease subunit